MSQKISWNFFQNFLRKYFVGNPRETPEILFSGFSLEIRDSGNRAFKTLLLKIMGNSWKSFSEKHFLRKSPPGESPHTSFQSPQKKSRDDFLQQIRETSKPYRFSPGHPLPG